MCPVFPTPCGGTSGFNDRFRTVTPISEEFCQAVAKAIAMSKAELTALEALADAHPVSQRVPFETSTSALDLDSTALFVDQGSVGSSFPSTLDLFQPLSLASHSAHCLLGVMGGAGCSGEVGGGGNTTEGSCDVLALVR